MDKDLVIKTVGQTKLDNAMHVTYHADMYGILKSADPTKTGIPVDVMTAYNGGITEETELNREAQANPLTAELAKADQDRDRAVTYLFGVVRASRHSPDEATRKAAEGLMPTVSVYKGVATEAADRETALLSGLLVDLKKPDLAAHLTTLGLSAVPAKIEAANKTFAELSAKRADSRAAAKLPLASVVRPKTDAAYERILFTLRSNYLFGASPIEKPALEELATRLNQRAAELDSLYRQGLALKKAAKTPKKPKDPKPKDPKKPKDDDAPDIHLPEEDEPKKPGEGGASGTGSGPEIHLPEG